MDGGDVGRIRALYYRELVARFGIYRLGLDFDLFLRISRRRPTRRRMTCYSEWP